MSKKETISLIDTFSEFKELKSIDRSTLISVMEESFRNVITKLFGTDENYDVIINPEIIQPVVQFSYVLKTKYVLKKQ